MVDFSQSHYNKVVKTWLIRMWRFWNMSHKVDMIGNFAVTLWNTWLIMLW